MTASKFIIASLLCVLSPFISIGQSQRPLEIQLRSGIAFGAYGTETAITNGSEKWTDQSGAATSILPIDLRWEMNERWAFGVHTRFGSYLYGSEESNYKDRSNRIRVFGLAAEYNLVSKEKFRWYAGLGFGISNLRIQQTRIDLPPLSTKEEYFLRGGNVRLQTGLIRWFGDSPLGFHLQMGFDRHRYTVQEIKLDGSTVNTADFNGTLTARGIDFQIGLVARIKR
jgi:hypothetical protein